MGLSYHYSMRCKIEEGLLYFILFRSAQVAQAFEVAKKILDGFLTGETPFEPLQLEAAVSSTIFELVEREKTVSDVGKEAMLSSLRRTSYSYNQDLLKGVSKVTVEQLKHVGQKYFSKLFEPQFTSCAVCCTPNKEEEVKEMLQGLGWKVSIVEDVEKMCIE
jgi:Zn-dependent M16 (insulinase) family peptidase